MTSLLQALQSISAISLDVISLTTRRALAADSKLGGRRSGGWLINATQLIHGLNLNLQVSSSSSSSF
jgi:hypothetical protein